MKIVGLTGGIASGKSTVCRILQSLDIPIIDSDLIAREVVLPGRPAYRAIVKHFGKEILLSDGMIDRPKLGGIVFSDPTKRRLLNRLTHPAIRKQIFWQILKYWLEGEKMIVLDAPLLFEAQLDRWVSTTIVIYISEKLQLSRLLSRDADLTEAAALDRIHSQIPLSEKASRANHVIDNSGEVSETSRQVHQLVRKLMPSTEKWLIEWAGPPLALAVLIGGIAWWKGFGLWGIVGWSGKKAVSDMAHGDQMV